MDHASQPDDETRERPARTVGRFRLVESLGRGGMGVVFLADDPLLDRRVALKLLAGGSQADPERRAFFKREATSAAALNHPNICTIFEVGEADDQPFIAMEAIEGRTLQARLAESPLAPAEAIEIALQIAAALEHAEERHIVHRDLKSANIMLTPKGGVKVLDFGLAKRQQPVADTDARTTAQWSSQNDVIFGTLPYMSPEQALGRVVDHRSDLFSFGTILYEALCGHLPFNGPTTPEVLNAIVNREPAPLEQAPPPLAMVVDRLLAKQPADRYQSAREVTADLRAIQQTGDIARRRIAITRRRLLAAAAVAGIVVAASAGFAWWRSHRITVSGGSPSLVVVPAAVTGAAQFQFLADAIPNSLTTRLSEHGGMKMKIPPSSIEFANVAGNLARIADSYGVTVCVVPRVTVSSGRVHVNVQVVDARARDILWTGDFESTLDKYADAVMQAADGIATAVTGRRSAQADARPPANSALELALSRGEYYGRLFNQKYQQADADLARAAYEEALQIDPKSAPAAAGLAYLEIYALQGGAPAAERLPVLERWARQATEFDPQYALGWAALVNAERWKPRADFAKLLEYGFRAVTLDESCGRCQLALHPALTPFSMVLKHHNAQHASELDPLWAFGLLNSATALTALGRADEATATMARAQTIEPDTLWVKVHQAFIDAGAGSLTSAAAEAEALRTGDRLKTLPGWVASILDLIRAVASTNRDDVGRAVERLRTPIRKRTASLLEMQYVTAVAVTVLARAGYPDAALDVLGDVTAADAPPAYDMIVMNPFLKGAMENPRGRAIAARARERFDVLVTAIAAARTAGQMPKYLEQPLQNLLSSLRDAGRAG